MTSAVIMFPRRPSRAWILEERQPGEWTGERVEADGCVVERVQPGPGWRVSAIVNDFRKGLPIVRRSLGCSTLGDAA